MRDSTQQLIRVIKQWWDTAFDELNCLGCGELLHESDRRNRLCSEECETDYLIRTSF